MPKKSKVDELSRYIVEQEAKVDECREEWALAQRGADLCAEDLWDAKLVLAEFNAELEALFEEPS